MSRFGISMPPPASFSHLEATGEASPSRMSIMFPDLSHRARHFRAVRMLLQYAWLFGGRLVPRQQLQGQFFASPAPLVSLKNTSCRGLLIKRSRCYPPCRGGFEAAAKCASKARPVEQHRGQHAGQYVNPDARPHFHRLRRPSSGWGG